MRLTFYRGYWCATWREGGETRRTSLRTKDRAAAETALADLQTTPSGPDDTLATIYPAYLLDKGTERATYAWKQLAGTFGSLRADQIGRPLSRTYVEARRKAGVGDGTIHTELTYLRAALLWHDKHTPAIVELPSKPAPKTDYLTHAQYLRLLGAAETPHLRLFIILALATAGRATAILQLTWDRVDFTRRQINLADDGPQTKKGRALVAMNDTAFRELTKAAESRSQTCNHVIQYGEKPVLRIVKSFRTAANAVAMPWCTPHVLRHTAAVWMAEAGVEIGKISQFMGHTDSKITERVYARFSPGHLADAAKTLDISE